MPLDTTKLPKDEKSGLPVVEAPKGTNNVAIPEDIASKTFNVEDFEVQQLPEQGSTESDTTKVEDKTPAKAEDKKDEPETEEVEKEEVVEEEPKVEELKDPLAGILKRPGAKTDEASKGKEKPLGIDKSTRDYTGYAPEEVTMLKNMSTESFNRVTKILKENKELSKLKDSNYLQHERAYTLSPEYNELATNTRLANFEQKYWNEQLLNMDAGKDLIPLKGYDNRTGQPVFGEPMKPSKALEEEVRQAMYNASNTAQQYKNKLQEFPSRYKSTVQADLSFIENYRKQQFAWANDPTMMDATIDVGGVEKSLKQITQDVDNMIPAYMRSHPLVNIIKDLVISTRIQKAQLSQYETTTQTAKTKADESELVEPSSREKVSNKGKGTKVHGMETFEVDPSLV